MDNSLLIFILGSIFGLVVFYITQYFVWDRSNRHFILEKYERAYSCLINENQDLIYKVSALPNINSTVLNPNHSILRAEKFEKIINAENILERIYWKIDSLSLYDCTLEDLINEHRKTKYEYLHCAHDVAETLLEYKEVDIQKLCDLENKYKDVSVRLMDRIAMNIGVAFENPFAKKMPKF